jgi:hypothetical protein
VVQISPVAAFDATLTGAAIPPAGHWCTFRETHWSYRQPISYEVYDAVGNLVGTVLPADRSTRTAAVARVGNEVRLLLTVGRDASVSVADPFGREIGLLVNRFRIGGMRIRINQCHQQVATLNQEWNRITLAEVRAVDGTAMARIHRSAGARFAGAAMSSIELVPPTNRLPAALAFATVPALDAARRRERRRRAF